MIHIRKRGYKTEILPNAEQKALIEKSFGCARFAYNWGLNLWKNGICTGAIDLNKYLTPLKTTDFPWMYEVSKCAPQEALRDLDLAFKRFYNKKGGYPKFKKKYSSKQSFRMSSSITERNGRKYSSIEIFSNKIKFPILGLVNLKEKDYIPINQFPKQITISKKADKYFVSVVLTEKQDFDISFKENILGIDLGIEKLITTSDFEFFYNPEPYKKHSRKIKRQQRSISRSKKGSCNRKKKVIRFAKTQYKISCIRKDYIHKITTKLVKNHPKMIVMEDLDVKEMQKNRYYSKSLSDAAFGTIKEVLKYKCEWLGIDFIENNRWFASTKICSNCGKKKDSMPTNIRIYKCLHCGFEIDRDVNAAINLRNQGTVSHTGTSGSNPLRKASGEPKRSRGKKNFSLIVNNL